MLEARFLDGEWTPFNTTGDDQKDRADDDDKPDTPPPPKKVRRQKKGKENAPQPSSTKCK